MQFYLKKFTYKQIFYIISYFLKTIYRSSTINGVACTLYSGVCIYSCAYVQTGTTTSTASGYKITSTTACCSSTLCNMYSTASPSSCLASTYKSSSALSAKALIKRELTAIYVIHYIFLASICF